MKSKISNCVGSIKWHWIVNCHILQCIFVVYHGNNFVTSVRPGPTKRLPVLNLLDWTTGFTGWLLFLLHCKQFDRMIIHDLCCTLQCLDSLVHVASICTGPPPAYTTLVGYPAMSQSGHHSSPAYNPASAAASAASSSVCDGGDVLPSKMWRTSNHVGQSLAVMVVAFTCCYYSKHAQEMRSFSCTCYLLFDSLVYQRLSHRLWLYIRLSWINSDFSYLPKNFNDIDTFL